MTQPINVNDVLEVTLEGSVEQQPFAHVRHYLATAVASPQSFLDMIIGHYTGIIIDKWKDVATDLWVAECISIGRVAPQPRNVYFYPLTPAVVGEVTTDGLPPQSAIVVRLTTDEVGPRNRGRSYLCGVPEASTNGGVLLASVKAAWDLIGSAMASTLDLEGDTATPVIFSRAAYNIPPAEEGGPVTHPADVTVYTSPVSGYATQGNIGTIRRRRTKRNLYSS